MGWRGWASFHRSLGWGFTHMSDERAHGDPQKILKNSADRLLPIDIKTISPLTKHAPNCASRMKYMVGGYAPTGYLSTAPREVSPPCNCEARNIAHDIEGRRYAAAPRIQMYNAPVKEHAPFAQEPPLSEWLSHQPGALRVRRSRASKQYN